MYKTRKLKCVLAPSRQYQTICEAVYNQRISVILTITIGLFLGHIKSLTMKKKSDGHEYQGS